MVEDPVDDKSRRDLIKGIAAIGIGLGVLSLGALNKAIRYFAGPHLSAEEKSKLSEARLKGLESTVAEGKLELERQSSESILVSKLSDLDTSEGKYFIDFQMQPALAFLGADGLPDLLSAKCTHLGCTVQNHVDDKGKILCPCHLSYFNMKTGVPDPGSPAKAPLPHLAWALKDDQGNVVVSRAADGTQSGNFDKSQSDKFSVFVVKPATENRA